MSTTMTTTTTAVSSFFDNYYNKYYFLNSSPITKTPIDGYQKYGITGWPGKTGKQYTRDLLKHLNINTADGIGYGVKCGLQPNGDFLIGLDFDIYGKSGDGYVKNNKAEALFNKFIEITTDGVWSSGTEGNYGCLVRIIDQNLIDKISKLKQDKFTVDCVEILLQTYFVLPPSQSICKRSGVLRARKLFNNNEPFHTQNNESKIYIENMINLYEGEYNTIKKNTISKKPKKICKKFKEIKNEPTIISNNKYLRKDKKIYDIADLIDIDIIDSYDTWTRIIWSCRSNEEQSPEDNFNLACYISSRGKKQATKLNGEYLFDEVEKIWDDYEENRKGMSIGTIYGYAKESNPIKFNTICNVDNAKIKKEGLEKMIKKSQNIQSASITPSPLTSVSITSPSPSPSIVSETPEVSNDDLVDLVNNITNATVANVFYVLYKEDFKWNMNQLYYWTGDIWNNEISESVIHNRLSSDVYLRLHSIVYDKIQRWTDSHQKANEQNPYTSLLKSILSLLERPFREKTYKDILDKYKINATNEYLNLTEDQKANIHFKNGVLQLDKIESVDKIMDAFRPRVKTDFVSGFNNYDFVIPSPKALQEVSQVYEKIQTEQSQRDFFLSYLSYCLTGFTEQQICEFCIGYKASNGKSAHLEIHSLCMPFYTHKMDNKCFNENYTKTHKQFIKLVEKPIRMAIMEELKCQKIDTSVFKDFVDGKELNIEIMYGTSVNRSHQAKLKITGNADPNIDNDNGVLRRGRKLDFESVFKDNVEDDFETRIFKNDNTLIDNFKMENNKNEYCSAYIVMLIPYVIEYLKTKNIKTSEKIKNAFKDMVEEYDQLGSFIKSRIERTTEKIETDERVGKLRLMDAIHQNGMKYGWRTVLTKMKNMGYGYNKNLKYKHNGKTHEGAFNNTSMNDDPELIQEPDEDEA